MRYIIAILVASALIMGLLPNDVSKQNAEIGSETHEKSAAIPLVSRAFSNEPQPQDTRFGRNSSFGNRPIMGLGRLSVSKAMEMPDGAMMPVECALHCIATGQDHQLAALPALSPFFAALALVILFSRAYTSRYLTPSYRVSNGFGARLRLLLLATVVLRN